MIKTRISILLMLFLLPAALVQAQDTEFQTANRLLQQQNYEEARVILRQLHEQNPGARIFLDRLLDCLVALRNYDEALEVIGDQIRSGRGSNQLSVRHGEIRYLRGDREEAFGIWNEVIAGNRDNIQYYYQIGSVLMNNREYSRAAGLYRSAREEFDDESLFINEVAAALMQSGDFAAAMSEYFRLILQNPNQLNFVQQRLVRMQDRELLATAAAEMEDFIVDLETGHPSYPGLHQLYMWLLVETEQFDRAFTAARLYESGTEAMNYSLFSLADQLVAGNEFGTAVKAYSYYVEEETSSVRNQAMDRLSRAYMLWAGYLDEYNLEESRYRDELYRKAYETGAGLLEAEPGYRNRSSVMIRLVELSLDFYGDPDQAARWISRLEADAGRENRADLHYLRGRLHLFNNSWPDARQAFTRAGREAGDSDLSEKSRYFLSLTDFFSGDFEFSLLQLRSLERRNVSWYANNALKLRMWIQQGERVDTTGENLGRFAGLMQKLYGGDVTGAIETLAPLMEIPGNPLFEHALAEISSRSRPEHMAMVYTLLNRHVTSVRNSPLRERLLWEQAVTARFIEEAGIRPEADGFSGGFDVPDIPYILELVPDPSEWPSSVADVEKLYEQIVLEFPRGFYAPHAREELQNLNQPSL